MKRYVIRRRYPCRRRLPLDNPRAASRTSSARAGGTLGALAHGVPSGRPNAFDSDVAVVHLAAPHNLGEGGGEGVFIHALVALQREYPEVVSVSNLVAMQPLDAWVERMNRYWGTELDARRLRVFTFADAPAPLNAQGRLLRRFGDLWTRYRRYQRLESGAIARPRLWLSTCNELPVTGNVVQYVHYPAIRPHRRSDVVRRALHGFNRLLTGVRMERRLGHTTLTNSQWTRNACHKSGLQDVQVLYPPVRSAASPRSWGEREELVVTLGRIVPGKRLEVAIEIVRRARREGAPLRHCIVGASHDRTYLEHLKQVAGDDPVSFHLDLPREQVDALLGSAKYGLHTMRNEHFGMAPAEMLLAGCLPLVHRSGGQVEIVGERPELTFADAGEGAARLAALVREPELVERLLRDLEPLRQTFSVEAFHEGIREAVREGLAGASRAPN